VPAEPLDFVRKAERSRRAVRPAGDPERENGLNYEGVLNGRGTRPHPRAAEPLPPNFCRSIERAPKNANGTTALIDYADGGGELNAGGDVLLK
jgi:hypothetical protein